jgi:membrane-bound serine protease (ClpP class)
MGFFGRLLAARPVRCIFRLLIAALPLLVPVALAEEADESTAASPGADAAILSLHGVIDPVMVYSLERRIAEAREKGVSIIVFDMDTPGGLVTSSIEIADLIKNLPHDIKTVAWVNPNAHSGGAIVAVACNEIVMTRSSRIGDAQVIMGGPGGAAAVPEDLKPKANTPVINEFRASARLRGYSLVLAEAFVIPEREVWWLENKSTKERKFVLRQEKIRLLGETEETPSKDDDETSEEEDSTKASVESSAEPSTGESQWKLVETYHDLLLDMEVDAIQPIVPDDELLEMSPSEAYAWGFSKGIVADEDELRERYKLASVVHVVPTWSETLADWMTSMYVRGFLMVIILLGAYVEFHTPGVGVAGLVALIALAVFVGAPYLTGLANVWEILFLAVGVLLIALELFVIPGFGVAGICGIGLVIVGLLATFVPDEPGRSIPLYLPSLSSTWRGLQIGVITLVCSMAASLIGMVMLSKYMPRMPVFRRIVPENPTPSEVLMDDPYRGAARIGDIGMTEGPLRPAGKARFGSALVDVVSQGDYLGAHTPVEVVERRGNRVVVRAVT